MKSAARRAAASPSTCRSKPARSTRTTACVFDAVVLPVLRQFEPDLIIVSAGFDAHERDPLGGMRVSTAGVRAR